MNAEHTTLEKHLKKSTLVINVISIVTSAILTLGVIYGFYYKTVDEQFEQSNDIKEIKENQKKIEDKIQDSELFKGTSTIEIKSIQKELQEVKDKMDKIDSKLDKVIFQTR